MVNLGGFGAAIVAQSAIGLLVSVHLDYRVALLPAADPRRMGSGPGHEAR